MSCHVLTLVLCAETFSSVRKLQQAQAAVSLHTAQLAQLDAAIAQLQAQRVSTASLLEHAAEREAEVKKQVLPGDLDEINRLAKLRKERKLKRRPSKDATLPEPRQKRHRRAAAKPVNYVEGDDEY